MAKTDLARATWRKSSRSGGSAQGNCVEVAFVAPAIAVRDSKRPAGGALVVDRAAWRTFLTDLR